MKRFFTLREPQGCEGQYKTGLLGYDPVDCKHKALCIFTGYKIAILTLGAQESWRMLPEGFPMHCVIKDCVLCINGAIYYTCTFKGLPVERGIMSFDLRSEKFSLIKYPMDNDHISFSFVSYEGRLALMIGSDGRSDGRSSF